MRAAATGTVGAVWLTIAVAVWLTVAVAVSVAAGAAPAEPPPAAIRIRVSALAHVSADRPDVPHVEPSVAAHPSDPLRLIGTAITAPDRNAIRNLSSYRSDAFVSADGGVSWRRVALPGCHFDPWVAFGPDGEAYIACHDRRPAGDRKVTGVLVHRSPDGGDTWLEPVQVPLGEGRSVDQPKLVVDPTDGARRGTVYVAVGQWTPAPGNSNDVFATVVSRSTDGGRTFSAPVLVRHDSLDQQPFGAGVRSDGTLEVAFMDYAVSVRGTQTQIRHRRTWIAHSSDGGATFSLPTLLREQLDNELPWALAIDGSTRFTDRIYAVLDGHWVRGGAPPDGDDPARLAPLSLIASMDGGQSWTEPAPISDGSRSSNAQTPAVAVNRDGVVGVAWYDTRNHSQGPDDRGSSCFDVFFAASFDGGRRFEPNVRVTPATSCPQRFAEQARVAGRWRFGGDYSGLAAAADGAFHVLWADSRMGTYQLWSARVDVAAPPSAGHGEEAAAPVIGDRDARMAPVPVGQVARP